MAEETAIQDEFIDLVLMAYRTIKHMITRVTSFLLMYGREAILPINKPYDLRMRDCMMQIVKKVFYIREEA